MNHDRMLMFLGWVAGIFVTAIVILTLSVTSRSEPSALPNCQTSSPCKILVISQEEERILVGDKGIFDTALVGRPLDLTGAIIHFRDRLRDAPAGLPLPKPDTK